MAIEMSNLLMEGKFALAFQVKEFELGVAVKMVIEKKH
jgi:hypothetical protein